MCIKHHKPLNPKAQEWKPSSNPHQSPPPHSQPFAAAYYYSDQFIPRFHHQGFVPYTPYTVQQYPFHQYVSFPAINECFYQPKMGPVRKVESPVGLKSPKCPPAGDGFKKGGTTVDEKKMLLPPPPAKRKVWKPKGKAKVPPLKSSPPPRLGDEFYHPSNTTVMMKNIPNQLRRDFMLEFLDGWCKSYSLEYDFFYLPMDFRSKDNLGYAFVNFTSGGDAVKFKRILHNYKWGSISIDGELINSRKVCEITWARIQGKELLIKRFKSSIFICDKLEFLPVVLDPPRNGLDPDPATPVTIGTM